MMAVPALVVHPSGGIALMLALRLIGTAVALKIECPGDELGRGEFGEIVQQTLQRNAGADAVEHHLMPVPQHGAQMCDRVHGECLLNSRLLHYTTFSAKVQEEKALREKNNKEE
jgi:hypothetical protein